MSFFDKERYRQKLSEYYKDFFGENKGDFFYEQPAVNVWVFRRGNKIITLKSHIFTGDVSVQAEEGGINV